MHVATIGSNILKKLNSVRESKKSAIEATDAASRQKNTLDYREKEREREKQVNIKMVRSKPIDVNGKWR